MPTPLEIARSENRNFLLFSDEDLIDRLYDQYQDRYPNKQLFTEFLTTDVGQFDTSKLTPVSPNIPQTETETGSKCENQQRQSDIIRIDSESSPPRFSHIVLVKLRSF